MAPLCTMREGKDDDDILSLKHFLTASVKALNSAQKHILLLLSKDKQHNIIFPLAIYN